MISYFISFFIFYLTFLFCSCCMQEDQNSINYIIQEEGLELDDYGYDSGEDLAGFGSD